MKVLAALVVLMAVAMARPDDDHYDSKYDDFDVDSLVANKRLLKNYVACFLEKGSCTSEGTAFKKSLPEAIDTVCKKCTPKQRVNIRKLTKAIQESLPEEWKELVNKYDPEEKHKEALEKFLAESD